MRLHTIPCFVLLLASCNTQTNPLHDAVGDTLSLPKDSLGFYFPANIFHESSHADSFVQNWYASALYSFKEPVLSQQFCGHSIYRFLWSRSFDRPVVFTLHQSKGQVWLTTKILNQQPEFYDRGMSGITKEDVDEYLKDGYVVDSTEPDHLIKYADRKASIVYYKRTSLSSKEWNLFEQLLTKANFWKLPAVIDDGSTDGAAWVIEGHLKHQYHVVSYHGPLNDDLPKAGLYLIKLSGLQERIY